MHEDCNATTLDGFKKFLHFQPYGFMSYMHPKKNFLKLDTSFPIKEPKH